MCAENERQEKNGGLKKKKNKVGCSGVPNVSSTILWR